MDKYLIPLILFGSLILLMFVFVLTVLIFLYRNKKKIHKQKLQEISIKNKMELLQVKIEAQEEIMKLFSLEIHDNVCQMLGSLQLHLYEIKQNVGSRDQINRVIGEVDMGMTDILNELRNLSHVLNSDMILKMGLEESINKELDLFKNRYNAKCNLVYDPGFPIMTAEQEVILFRIFQTAFYNIIKHANATEIKVYLKTDEQQQYMSIHDNGKGIILQKQKEGIGWASLEERIKMLNGKLEVLSKENSGTNLLFTFKLDPYDNS